MTLPRSKTGDSFKVGIVGAGNVVSSNHLPVLKGCANIHLSWITDKDGARARTVARAYEVECFDLECGFENFPPVDAVLLAIPYGVRDSYYDVLKKRDVAVYVEKPFARTVSMHRALCESFADCRLACGLNRRAWGIVQFCKKLIEAETLGRVRYARFGLGNLGGITAANLYMANARISGGGMVFETGVHGIDTVLYCLDVRNSKFVSGESVIDQGHDIHCEALFSLVDGHGADIPFEVQVSRLKDTINRVEFEFDTCRLFFGLFGTPELFIESKLDGLRSILIDRKSYYPFTWNQVLFEFWQTFLEGTISEKRNYTSAIDSILATQVIEEIYEHSKINSQ